LARVIGNFPDDEIIVDKPMSKYSHKTGANAIDLINGKDAKTLFKKLSFDGRTSLVLCKPLTGRSHQIRVHLQYLSHPIANDFLYRKEAICFNNPEDSCIWLHAYKYSCNHEWEYKTENIPGWAECDADYNLCLL